MDLTVETLDPEALAAFVAELHAAGFEPVDEAHSVWEGPLRQSLRSYTTASTMRIVVHDGWPYVQPSVIVPGVRWWHATRERPCLWQEGDNSKRWVSLDGILCRLDEWAAKAAAGFRDLDGAALDPQYHFDAAGGGLVGVDAARLIGGLAQDGQHGVICLRFPAAELPVVTTGMGRAGAPWGRWFYRSSLPVPPATLDHFEAALTAKQRARYDKQLESFGDGLFMLAWPRPHGLATLILHVVENEGTRRPVVFQPTPTSQEDRLRRAGSDASTLRELRVVLFGVGAIGSHLGALLARSGLGRLTVVDGDIVTPAILVRHASGDVGIRKVEAFKKLLAPYDWTDVTTVDRTTWSPTEVTALIEGTDLCIDATGSSLFAELLSRVAGRCGTPMLSVALFRGGRLVRARRQADADTLIAERFDHWRYPEIPKGAEPDLDHVGVETGCAAPIQNAPPATVLAAAALAARASIDQLTCRREEPDEIIDVLEPIETPFDRRGRLQRGPPRVMVTDAARSTMHAAAAAAHPNETGGILIGINDGHGEPCVTEAVELPAERPTISGYVVPAGQTTLAVDAARASDHRLGYVGEWHSHPSDQPASPTDTSTMLRLTCEPGVADPVLIVVRPKQPSRFDLDSYIAIDGDLVGTRPLAMGPLIPPEEVE